MPEVIGEYVDRTVTIEMRPLDMPRGVAHQLYDAARQKQRRPLTLLAAEGLRERCRQGDTVCIITGAGVPPWLPKGETDGPPGAAGLARAIAVGLRANVIFCAADFQMEPIIACSEAAGIPVYSAERMAQRFYAATTVAFPTDDGGAARTANDVLDRFQPKAVISIERLGPNHEGIINSATGQPMKEPDAPLHHLIDGAKARGILTVGVGDAGNELGFGMIRDDVRRIMPAGEVMATVTATDVLVACAVSNHGAYGIGAVLAYLTDRREALITPEQGRWILEASARAGAIEAMDGRTEVAVDGLSLAADMALVTLLNEIVTNGKKRDSLHSWAY